MPHTMRPMGAWLPAMVDLRQEPGGELILSWTDPPGAKDITIARANIARLQHLVDAVSFAENRNQTAAVVAARTALSAALFELLDGPENALAQRIDTAGAAGRRLDLVVRATAAEGCTLHEHPATWMRWELLPFAETHRRGAPPFTVVLQLGPQELAPPRVLDSSGLRILFMAFSPHDAPPELDFEHEEEALLAALAPLAERRRARLRVVEEGTLDDLRAALLAERYDVVHLTGHGRITPDGPRLVMEDSFGGKRLVSPAEIIDVLERAKAMPELVMLAACHTAEVRGSVPSFAAELVAAGVPNVLGWTRPVRDDQATLAASVVYEQLASGKTPVDAAELAREHLRRSEERSPAPTHAWETLHLVSSAASGFRIDEHAEPLGDHADRDEVYEYLGSRMRVLKTGFVGRRRFVQRLLRVLLRGQDARPDGTRDVAGACVFGMKGVGKSCAVGRALERAKQYAPELPVVVVHGVIDERSVFDAFQQAIATSGGDEIAERILGWTDQPLFHRVRRVMEHWCARQVAIVLDDFEQNLERRSDNPWRVLPDTTALLGALLPACTMGTPKLLITSTAAFQVLEGHERALAFVPLGSFNAAAVRKLWMRGQASNELTSVSLKSWQELAQRLGRNARILTWARALCAGKVDAKMVAVAASAAAELPMWRPGDEASKGKHAELSRLFLQHMAYEEARAAFGEDALSFLKRARVFEAAVPKEAFVTFMEGLAVDLDRDLDALASWGLLEVGELDGARAYRVSPLVEPRFDVPDAARWHEAAAAAWEGLAEQADGAAVGFARWQEAWDHALQAGSIQRADRLAKAIHMTLTHAGLYADSLRLAEHHLKALPESPFGHEWAGSAEAVARQSGPRATELVQRGHALLVRALGTEEHPDVAASLHTLGQVLCAQGDLAGARVAHERSLEIVVKLFGTEEHLKVASVLYALGDVLWHQGDLAGARQAMERSLAISIKILGTEEHLEVAAAFHMLGKLLDAQGAFHDARKVLQRALDIWAKVFGTEEHPGFAASLEALGRVLLIQGDLAGARKTLERALDIRVKVFGTEEHQEVATSLQNLGGVLVAQGDLAGARKTLERALAIRAKVLGSEEHPGLAASLHTLGQVLHAQGDLIGARRAIERSLASRTKVLGTEEHQDVAVALHSLGVVLHSQGDLAGARQALERSLAIHAKVLGTDEHVAVAACLYELGTVLRSQGDLAGARQALERSLAIHAKVLGTDEHVAVARSLRMLGVVLLFQGDSTSAREVIERSLAIQAKVLDTKEHPDVAASLRVLGEVLQAQGDLGSAREIIERSLAIQTKVLGTEEHPEVAASLHTLGLVLHAQGDLVGARRVIERSLAIQTKVFGTEKPLDVALVLHSLGIVLRSQGALGAARWALECSFAIKAKVLGTEEHPDVAASWAVLGDILSAQGDLAGAREALERSLAILVKVVGGEEHPWVADTYALLADMLAHAGEMENAATKYRRALAIRHRCFGARDHYTSAESEVRLARILFHLGQNDEARALFQHGQRVLEEQVPNHPWIPQLRREALARDASYALERSIAIQTKELGTEEHPSVAALLHELARMLWVQGDLAGAHQALERSLAIQANVHGTEEHPSVAALLHDLARVLQAEGDVSGGRLALERSIAITTAVLGAEHPSVAASLYDLSAVLMVQGELVAARQALDRSIAIQANAYGTEAHTGVALAYDGLATVFERAGQLEDALASRRHALEIRQKCFGTSDHCMVAEAELEFAGLLFHLGREDEARALLQHAHRVLEDQVPNHRYLPDLRRLALDGWRLGPTVDEGRDTAGGAPPAPPCPCGSGKPFSNCHGAPDDDEPS